MTKWQWTILWTDWSIYLMLLISLLILFFSARRQDIRAAWQQVFSKKMGMITCVILIFYTSIALLDSIRIHEVGTINKTQTLLDQLFSPLDEKDERTYSKPFATHSLLKEAMIQSDGTVIRAYPDLEYVQSNNEMNTIQHILPLSKQALIKGCYISFLLSFILLVMIAWRRNISLRKAFGVIIHRQPDDIAWGVGLLTFSLIICLLFILFALSEHYHIFGTDKVGNDVFYETIKSIRTGMLIGLLTNFIMLPFAISLGLLAGYFGGLIDDIIQYLYTTLSAIPGVVLISASILALQIFLNQHPQYFTSLEVVSDTRLFALCVILGVTSWSSLCRLLRAETLKLKNMDYVQAARVLGSSHIQIIFRHILINVMHIVLIATVLDFSALVLAEAVLSYVGVGVDPTTISWGNMINNARLELAREPMIWWPLTSAFIFMFFLVLPANLFADTVREAFDPRH